eukprot:6928-Pelagococcus_subviridis.AAC.6
MKRAALRRRPRRALPSSRRASFLATRARDRGARVRARLATEREKPTGRDRAAVRAAYAAFSPRGQTTGDRAFAPRRRGRL